MTQKIIYPNCKTEISVDEVLTNQIGNELKKKFELDNKAKEEELVLKQNEIDEQKKKFNIKNF